MSQQFGSLVLSRLFDKLCQDDDLLAIDAAFNMFRIVGNQRNAAHGRSPLGGKPGPLDRQILDQGDRITDGQHGTV